MKCFRFSVPFKVRLNGIRIAYGFITLMCAIGIILILFGNRKLPIHSLNETTQVPFKKSLRFKYVKNVGNISVACRLPNLDPFHESVVEFIEDLGKLRCEGKSFSKFENNVLRIEGENIVSAQYRTIDRPPEDDFKILRSEPVPVPNMAEKTAEKAAKHEQYSTGM